MIADVSAAGFNSLYRFGARDRLRVRDRQRVGLGGAACETAGGPDAERRRGRLASGETRGSVHAADRQAPPTPSFADALARGCARRRPNKGLPRTPQQNRLENLADQPHQDADTGDTERGHRRERQILQNGENRVRNRLAPAGRGRQQPVGFPGNRSGPDCRHDDPYSNEPVVPVHDTLTVAELSRDPHGSRGASAEKASEYTQP